MNLVNSFKALVRGLLQMWWNLRSLKAAKRLGMVFEEEGKEKLVSLKEDPVNPPLTGNFGAVVRLVSTDYPNIIFNKIGAGRWSTPLDIAESTLMEVVFKNVSVTSTAKKYKGISDKLVEIFKPLYVGDLLLHIGVSCKREDDVYILSPDTEIHGSIEERAKNFDDNAVSIASMRTKKNK